MKISKSSRIVTTWNEPGWKMRLQLPSSILPLPRNQVLGRSTLLLPKSATLQSDAGSPPIQASELSRQTSSPESRFRSVSERQPTPCPSMENETMQETERSYRAEVAQSAASTAEDETALSSLSTPTIRSDSPFYISSAPYSASCSSVGEDLSNISESIEASPTESGSQIPV
jgi:hypothetical protein